MSQPDKYSFSQDWFTQSLHNFEHFLPPFRGQPVRFLEIGSYEGRSAIWLLDNILTHARAELYCIDAYMMPVFFQNVCKAGTFDPRTGTARGLFHHHADSTRCLRLLPLDHFDFIYVDGDHGDIAVLQDAVHAFPLLKDGGLLAFDDYLWDVPGYNRFGTPRAAIDAFLDIYRHRLEILVRNGQVWVRKTADRRGGDGA